MGMGAQLLIPLVKFNPLIRVAPDMDYPLGVDQPCLHHSS
jgi:hypothetical protein